MKSGADTERCAEASAEHLLHLGRFNTAALAFRARLQHNPNDADALLGLSAIARRSGRKGEAKDLLRRAARVRPLEGPESDLPGPVILRPRCIEAANYCAVRRGDVYKTKFKGGHFALKHLFPSRIRSMVTANLVGGDPSPLYAAPAPELFLNSIACADRSRSSLDAVARYLRDHDTLPVINRPEAVAATTRDNNYRRLSDIDGAIFPRTFRIQLDAPETALLERIAEAGMVLPLIIRSTGQQTGRSLYLCRTLDEVKTALTALGSLGEAYVIAYVDTRRPDGLFHKARAFFIDGQIYPVAWLTNDRWQIHSGDRYRVMTSRTASQIEEQRYLADPEAVCGKTAWSALREAGKRLALDFAGIDFTIMSSGELCIFEANAAMRHNFDHAQNFPYTRPYLENVTRAFIQMADERRQRNCRAPVSHLR